MTKDREKTIRNVFYKAIRFMLVADIVQSMQDMMLDYFISKHLGSDGLAAFGIVYPAITMIMALMAWVVAGVQTICARDIGENDYVSARKHLSTGLTWGFLFMSAFTFICWIFHYPLITALGAADEYAHLRGQSTEALLVGLLAGPFFCVLMILLTNLFFIEKRKTAVGLVFSTILIQVLATGVMSTLVPTMTGIWGGYVIGLAISDFVILLYLRLNFKTDDSMFYRIRFMIGFDGVKDSLKTGFPEFLCWSYYVLSGSLRNGLVLRIGSENALAAVTLSDGVEFGETLMTAVFYAVHATIGMAFGSNDREKYHDHVKTVAKSILKIALGGGLVLMLAAWPLLNLFVEEGESEAVFNIALKILVIYGFNFIFYLMNNMFGSLYETVGLLKYAHINYLLEVILYCAFMPLLGFTIGTDGVWIAQPIAEILLLLFNLGLAWKSCGHFPRSFADLSFDRALERAGERE
jgi:Na+-driven multidrug efflux pump